MLSKEEVVVKRWAHKRIVVIICSLGLSVSFGFGFEFIPFLASSHLSLTTKHIFLVLELQLAI